MFKVNQNVELKHSHLKYRGRVVDFKHLKSRRYTGLMYLVNFDLSMSCDRVREQWFKESELIAAPTTSHWQKFVKAFKRFSKNFNNVQFNRKTTR